MYADICMALIIWLLVKQWWSIPVRSTGWHEITTLIIFVCIYYVDKIRDAVAASGSSGNRVHNQIYTLILRVRILVFVK